MRAVQNEATRAFLAIREPHCSEKARSQPNLLALAAQALGSGEVEVVALALELGMKDVVRDGQDARRFALCSCLQPISVLCLKLAARRVGGLYPPKLKLCASQVFNPVTPLCRESIVEQAEAQ